MKKHLTLFVLLIVSVFAWAQNPKLSYQAVVRDSQNKLVAEQAITVTVNVLDAANASQFTQTLNATTNRNGLISLEIGDETDAWKNINWTDAKIRTAVVLSNGTEMVDTTNVNAVPFALYAEHVSDNFLSNYLDSAAVVRSIHDSLSVGTSAHHTHDNMATLNRTERAYHNADSTVITNLQSDLAAAVGKEKADSSTLAGRIDALENASMDCDDVNNCIKDTLSKYTPTDQLCAVISSCDLTTNSALLNLLTAMNARIDSLANSVDSLSRLPHGGDTPTVVADGQPCPGAATVSDVDGNTYNTVKIGDQCNTNIGKALASTTGWNSYTGTSSNMDCYLGYVPANNNATRFSAVPAGDYNSNGYANFGPNAYFWSATQGSSDYAYIRYLLYYGAGVGRSYSDKYLGFSVRCLRDNNVI